MPVNADEAYGTLPAWARPSTIQASAVQADTPVSARILRIDGAGMDRQSAEALVAAGARRLAELDALTSRYGPDLEDGAVIRFVVPLINGHLTYAAVRAGGLWYVTGSKAPQRLGWEQLQVWMDQRGISHACILARDYNDRCLPEDKDTKDEDAGPSKAVSKREK